MKDTRKKFTKVLTAIGMAGAVFAGTITTGSASTELTKEEYQQACKAEQVSGIVDNIFRWKKVEEGINPSDPLFSEERLEYAGTSVMDWYAFAIGRMDCQDNYDEYCQALMTKIVEKYKTEDKLDANSATEWHRQILTLLALGEDPTYIIDEEGYLINLVEDGTYNRGVTKSLGEQGLNGYIWALIALDSCRYPVPDGAADTRETMIQAILTGQNEDGGFSLTEGISDVDITAMALQALAPYADDMPEVKEAVTKAVDYLSGCQNDDGTMKNGTEATAESTAQVITALCCLNMDPDADERFVKNGNSLLDGLLLFRNGDGGFSHLLTDERESNSLVGEQVAIGLCAYERFCLGEGSVYDFTTSEEASNRTAYIQLRDEIDTINSRIQNSLYPLEQLDEKQKQLASKLLEQVEELPDYVHDQILEYDQLQNAVNGEEASPSGATAVTAGIVGVAVVAAGAAYILFRNKKKTGVK